MSDVFISFIHEELEYAEAVQSFLRRTLGHDVDPFLSSDKFQVYAGDKWLDRIMSELATAKVVLLMLSLSSVERPWVNFEAGAAWTRDIITIPICFGGLEKDQLPKPYSSLQAVDLMQWDDHKYLARSVAHHLGLPEPRFLDNLYGLATMALAGPDAPAVKRKVEDERLAWEQFRGRLNELENERDKN